MKTSRFPHIAFLSAMIICGGHNFGFIDSTKPNNLKELKSSTTQ
jgi:hypothetical protein